MTTPAETPATHHPASRVALLIAVACAMLFGAGMATQARVNGELGRRLDNGYLAALISFGSGLLIVAVAMLLSPTGRRGLVSVSRAVTSRAIPWWYVCGGAAGALLVLSQGLTSVVLGVALFTIAIVGGQTLAGMLIDRHGLGTMVATPITAPRIAGSILALVAVVFTGANQLRSDIPLWMLLMPLVAGFGVGWQQAVNGQVRQRASSAITATFINFVVGTTVLAVVTLVHAAFAGWPSALPTEPWLYLGGAIGVIFIAGATVVVHITGVLLLGLATISGQLVTSLLLDLLYPAAGHALGWTTVVGCAIALIAVALTALAARTPRAARAR